MAVYYRFARDHDVRVRYGVTVAYRAGLVAFVPEAHAISADQAKAGERITREQAKAAREQARAG